MSEIPLAGTDLYREILGEVLDERGKPGSDPQQPATTFAEQIQDAIDSGANLDWIRRHFHLSESELRDYCSVIADDDYGDPSRSSGTACGLRLRHLRQS